MGSLFEHLVDDIESDGRLGVSLVTQPAGIAPPLHVHANEAEAFYLLEGTMTYRAGDEMHHLAAGDFIHLPPGVPHAFRVTGTGVRFLSLVTPGRLLSLYDEVGLPAAERRIPDPAVDGRTVPDEIARWNEIGPRYGLTVVGPPLPPE
jgi:quercetin dioxygenase-like cupin family protein